MLSNSVCNHTRDYTNRTPATWSSDFDNHSYDYRPNWTQLSPVTITNRHWGKHASIQMFIKHSGGSRGEAQALIVFQPKWWPKIEKIYETPFLEHKVRMSSTPITSRSGSITEQFNICLWCKMLDSESHLNAMLREVANQKNKLFKHDAGWKCLII